MSQAKSNLGRLDLPNRAYSIEEAQIATPEGPASVGRLLWRGESDRSVADLLRSDSQEEGGGHKGAAKWLQEPDVLGLGQERHAQELCAAAKEEGIAARTLQRASSGMCVTRRDGFGGKVWWRLKDAILANLTHSRQSPEAGDNGENVATIDGVAMVGGEL